jgi:hypothetical protein
VPVAYFRIVSLKTRYNSGLPEFETGARLSNPPKRVQ